MPDGINIRVLSCIFRLEEMSSTHVSRWEWTPSYAPTPGDFGREWTPSVCPSPAYTYSDRSSPSHRPAPDCLGFLDDTELNWGRTYNEDTPKSIDYLVEWKVTLNNRILAKDTEQDLVFKPSAYWHQIKEKAEHIVQQKKSCTVASFDQADSDIPWPIEVVMEEYTNWHLAKVSTNNFKDNIQKARDIVLDNCLDLGQLHNPRIGPDFFVKEGVKIGVAYRFVGDTKKWLKQCKRKRYTEDDRNFEDFSG